MPLPAPNLDDRRFEDIVAQTKALIPRYAPAWTNLNEADPGITLIQLFAWMAETMLYRMNQVPDRNYIKFLDLIGIRLQPARPARTELTFTPSRTDVATFSVPQGTQAAAAGGAGAPVVFETDEGLIAITARLAAVQTFDGFEYSIQTTANQSDGQKYPPFGPRAAQGAALLLGFDSPIAFPSDPIDLAVYIDAALTAPGPVHCSALAGVAPPAGIVWEYWNGSLWQAGSLNRDETRAFTRNGHITVQVDGSDLPKAVLGLVAESLYWIRARLDSTAYDQAPSIDTIVTNTVRVTQAITVTDEILGGSNGQTNQTFRLANAPVIVLDNPYPVTGADTGTVKILSLRLEVDEGSGFAAWQEVADFYSSTEHDSHYTLDRSTGEVLFGARIPVANPANPNGNIVARQYRFGGGAAGNVGAGVIAQIQTFVDNAKGVTNRLAAAGGSDTETLDQARLRAPQEIKSRDRAVTAEDFEFLAGETPGVRIARAKALPLSHPKFTGAPIPGVVSVIVIPDSHAPKPSPSQTTLEAVCAWLNNARLLTSELYVVPPVYRKVRIDVNLIARPDADLGAVRKDVAGRLDTFFHALTGGDDGQGWPFGGTIFYSSVYRVILQAAGVSRISDNQLVIWLDDERQQFCRDVDINAGEVLYSDTHQIAVQYDAAKRST